MDKQNHSAKRLLCISVIFLAAAGILSAASRTVPGFAQWYSTTIYPAIQGSLGRLTGLASLSVAEMLCFLLPVLIVIDLIAVIRRSRRVSGSHPLRRFALHLLTLISVLIFLYEANCGVNYYRDSFVDREAFEAAEFTEEDLTGFCELSISKLKENSEKIHSSTDASVGDMQSADQFIYPDKTAISEEAIRSMKELSEQTSTSFSDYSSLAGFYPHPKYLTFMSRLFSNMGVSGIYSPFTVEANVNGEMTGLEKPFTSCHELSHLKGFMNEGEANYIGWLACINSDDPAFNRSGWIIAWIYAGNSLYSIDQDKYSELRKKLPDDVIRELDENHEFWKSHETRASEVQDRVNDAYLRSNGQKEGIQTYGQLTTLMLMWYTE